MSESTQPGPTWLTAMPSAPHSRAITPTRCPAACFDLRHPSSGLCVVRDVVDRDVEAAFREHEGDAAADPPLAGGAGDERHRHQITTEISPSSLTRES